MVRDSTTQEHVQSIDRAVMLLRAVADARSPLTAPELAERCGLNRSTAWRLLASLENHGLVMRDAGNRYLVGHAVLQLAAAAGDRPLVALARPHLERLAAATAATVTLAVPRNLELEYVDQVQGPRAMSANLSGRSWPLHATSAGKAFLATLAEVELAKVLALGLGRYTERTIVDPERLRAELAVARELGYATSWAELEEALWGVAAPVLRRDGQALAVVSAWGAAPPVKRCELAALGRATLATAAAIEAELSGAGSDAGDAGADAGDAGANPAAAIRRQLPDGSAGP